MLMSKLAVAKAYIVSSIILSAAAKSADNDVYFC